MTIKGTISKPTKDKLGLRLGYVKGFSSHKQPLIKIENFDKKGKFVEGVYVDIDEIDNLRELLEEIKIDYYLYEKKKVD